MYLPPYSPNYNPVEEFFSVLKKWMKGHHEAYQDEESFAEFIHLAVEACSGDVHAKQHFRHAGISVQ